MMLQKSKQWLCRGGVEWDRLEKGREGTFKGDARKSRFLQISGLSVEKESSRSLTIS